MFSLFRTPGRIQHLKYADPYDVDALYCFRQQLFLTPHFVLGTLYSVLQCYLCVIKKEIKVIDVFDLSFIRSETDLRDGVQLPSVYAVWSRHTTPLEVFLQ